MAGRNRALEVLSPLFEGMRDNTKQYMIVGKDLSVLRLMMKGCGALSGMMICEGRYSL